MQINPFIDAARQGRNEFGVYVAVFILVFIANLLGSIPGAWAMVTWKDDPQALPVYLITSLMLLGFVASLVVLWLCVKHLHKRNPLMMISPSGVVNWPRILKSAGLWMVCSAVVETATYLLFPDKYQFSLNLKDFLPSLVVAIVLLPLQTSFEELFFRGYLLQGIGSWNLWAGIIITSVVFGLAHSFNDEIEAVGSLGLAMVYYIGVGLFFALLGVIDKSLELPLGIHLANNVYAFLLVGYPSSSVPSSTIWMTTELNFPLMVTQWVVVMALYLLLAKKVVGLQLIAKPTS
ncbi:CPBP family intramembrane metalloprotease [Runella sp. CRIBMP]|uniref:CPBP family intramembrane glutamic endopeptidase n=1 Tax=Runella sp. CRIBMP TaxID=2683261 RepID=UPI0014132A72|nr:CPBP family intramembrane glutamic endopeptidase [Runella sp. CRIBMP]NBB18356.1 CPBP family intramembrane metalloprotease [Runella sp. CRIBMP]